MLQVLQDMGADLAIGLNVVDGSHSRTNISRLNWAPSRIKVEPVTEQAARAAAELLKGTGLHGHKYAIDTTVADVALRQPNPVGLLTSDYGDTEIALRQPGSHRPPHPPAPRIMHIGRF